jgi:hypothetical protein
MHLGWTVGLVIASAALTTGCGAEGSTSAVSSAVTKTATPATPKRAARKAQTQQKPKYPDPLAWGKKAIRDMGATGRWKIVGATVNDDVLNVETPLYDKASNRGPGPAIGICTVFIDYGKANRLQRIVVHASNYAALASAESTETEGWNSVQPAWACHPAG